MEREQVERLRALRASRSNSQVKTALQELNAAAKGTDNLLPKILTACRSLATVGEISDTMRQIFGEYRENF